MKILIVEDDYLQHQFLKVKFQSEFKDCTIDVIETESDFLNKLSIIESNPPDIILMDIMLRWQNPSQAMLKEIPQNALDHYRSGFRCQQILTQRESTKNIPIILYTVLNKEDLEFELRNLSNRVIHMMKETEIASLFNQIRKMIREKPDQNSKQF